MKKALVLAGGFPQIALIKELKNRGYFTILADFNENPIAKEFADKYYRESTLDVDEIKNIAINEKVEFIVTVCTDQALLTVAKVSEELNLPCYVDYQTALNVTNKSYMKNVFKDNNISTSNFAIMQDFEEDKIANLKFPLIVKPVDCNSSKGVIKVNNQEELKIAFENAVNLTRTNTAVVEEFISGIELSVDVYVENGKANVLSISKLDKIKDNDKFVIFRGWSPAEEAFVVIQKIENMVQQIADAFNLKNTPMLVQLISDGKEVYVLEFSARTGGGVKYLLIKKSTGFDVIKAVVDLIEGKIPHYEKKEPDFKFLVNEFIYCYPGKFSHLEGFEELKNQGIIADYYLIKWKGAEFNTIANSGDRIAGFTIQGNSIDELNEKHKMVIEKAKVIDENGKDMMRRDILTNLK